MDGGGSSDLFWYGICAIRSISPELVPHSSERPLGGTGSFSNHHPSDPLPLVGPIESLGAVIAQDSPSSMPCTTTMGSLSTESPNAVPCISPPGPVNVESPNAQQVS